MILAAAAARTSRIRLGSAVAVLSAADPVRVFQQFATLDLISKGRIDLVVGRGSFTEAFPLFGLDLADYDSLFAEKLDLLLRIRESEHVTWSGRHRPALTGQGVYPRPLQDPLPIWVGRRRHAGVLRPGRPARAAADGRDHRRRAAPVRARWSTSTAGPARRPGTRRRPLQVGLHVFGFVAESTQAAADTIYPGWHEMFTQGLPGARLRAADAGPVRRDQRAGRRLLHGRPATPSPPSSCGCPSSSAGSTGSRCR